VTAAPKRWGNNVMDRTDMLKGFLHFQFQRKCKNHFQNYAQIWVDFFSDEAVLIELVVGGSFLRDIYNVGGFYETTRAVAIRTADAQKVYL
jgi:hypothetical protein